MSDKYTDLLDTADRIAVVDLYPARLRTVISDLSAALRETSALLTESRDYGSALVEELRARTEKLDQLLLLANSMDADFESYTKVHPAVQPKVKPLVWHEGDEPDEWKSGPYDVWREFGRYQLYHWSVVVGEPHKTASAAKAAAQADHEARILPALEPAVQPDLTDPVVVHANMLRGAIAKPTLDQIIHLYGVDALCRALVPVISREAALDEMARLGQEFDAALKGESHE